AGQVDGSGVGLLAAVLAGAVAFDGVGHGASPLGGDRHGGVEAVAGMGSGGFEQVVGDGGLVVGIDQGAVVGAGLAQLGVGALGGDLLVVEEDDLIGQGGRGFAVGDQQQRRFGHLAADAVQDRQLHAGVAGAGGVVEHEQAVATGQSPGQGDALALPAGQRPTALPQLGVQTLR